MTYHSAWGFWNGEPGMNRLTFAAIVRLLGRMGLLFRRDRYFAGVEVHDGWGAPQVVACEYYDPGVKVRPRRRGQ